jgi:hypothetical protein
MLVRKKYYKKRLISQLKVLVFTERQHHRHSIACAPVQFEYCCPCVLRPPPLDNVCNSLVLLHLVPLSVTGRW